MAFKSVVILLLKIISQFINEYNLAFTFDGSNMTFPFNCETASSI